MSQNQSFIGPEMDHNTEKLTWKRSASIRFVAYMAGASYIPNFPLQIDAQTCVYPLVPSFAVVPLTYCSLRQQAYSFDLSFSDPQLADLNPLVHTIPV